MYYFIVNLTSRSGKAAAIWESIKEYMEDTDVDYKSWVLEYEGHATQIASYICDHYEGEINMVVVGGDGTANEVVNGITDFDRVNFAIIPTGSGNDLVRGLGYEGKPLEHLKRILSSKESRRIDIGRVIWLNDEGEYKNRLFAISSGVGMDAIVCKKALTSRLKKVLNRIGLGKLTYLVITIQTLFSMHTVDAMVRYGGESEDSRNVCKLIFAAAMNMRAEGGGVPMAPDADFADGRLSVCYVSGIPKWKTFLVLPFLVLAKHKGIKGVCIEDCEAFEMNLSAPEVLHADGEYLGEVTYIRFECVPQGMRII